MARAQYKIRVQGTPRFSVRKWAALKVGAKCWSWVHLTVTRRGKVVFKGWHQLKSGLEVYGDAMSKAIKPRTLVHVVIHT